MIIDTLIVIVYEIVATVLELLPIEPSPPDLAGKASAFAGQAGARLGIIGIFPVFHIAAALISIRASFLAISFFRLAAWILTMIHVSGGKG